MLPCCPIFRFWIQRIPLLWITLWLTGCAGYHLGPTGGFKAGAQSAEIGFFQNETTEPGLAESLSVALRQQIQRDGTLTLETRDHGQLLFEGTLLNYQREGLTFQPQDILTVRDFEITLTAQVKVLKRASGELLLDREITGRTLIRGQIDLTEAERRAMPLLMEDLSRNIVDLVVNGDW